MRVETSPTASALSAATWFRRYREMPHGERLAVLLAIMALAAEQPMATVSRQSLKKLIAEQRAQFADAI